MVQDLTCRVPGSIPGSHTISADPNFPSTQFLQQLPFDVYYIDNTIPISYAPTSALYIDSDVMSGADVTYEACHSI